MDIFAMVEELQRQMAAAEAAITIIQTSITALQTAIAAYPAQFTAINASLSDLETCSEGVNAEIDALQTATSGLTSTVSTVQAALTTTQANVVTLGNSISEYPARFTAIENSVSSLNSTLGGRITANESDIDEITDDIGGINTAISGVQSGLSAAQSSIATLTSGQTTANGKISALETDFDAVSAQYTAQQLEINAIEAQNITTISNVASNTTSISQLRNTLNIAEAALEDQITTQLALINANSESIEALEAKHADSGWIELNLTSGWTKTQYASETPQYRRIGNMVYLRGLVNATSAAGITIAVLPAGYRPSTNQFTRFSNPTGQTGVINVQVGLTGAITDYTKGTQAREFVSLYGVQFTTN